jgi:hypothetical protein
MLKNPCQSQMGSIVATMTVFSCHVCIVKNVQTSLKNKNFLHIFENLNNWEKMTKREQMECISLSSRHIVIVRKVNNFLGHLTFYYVNN